MISYPLFKYEDKVFEENNTGFADPSFFTFFDFHLIKGNPANPFPDDHSIVIPEKTANRYFGDEDPIGKVIIANDTVNFTITGVIKDFPEKFEHQWRHVFADVLAIKTSVCK